MNFFQLVFLFCFPGFHATVAEEVVYAQVGENVQLKSTHGADKYFRWHFGEKQMAWFNPVGGKHVDPDWRNRVMLSPNALVMKNVTASDFGVFSCTVRDRFRELAKEVFRLMRLDVTVEPSVLLPGERLTLSVTNPERSLQIHWVDPRGQKMEGVRGRVEVQAAAGHSGHWTFVVSEGAREKRGSVKVTVIDLLPPAPVRTLYASASRPLTVPCSLSANTSWEQVKSKGVVQVGWNFRPSNPEGDGSGLILLSLEAKPTWTTPTDGTLRPGAHPGLGDLSLGRSVWREADAGDYECLMKFEGGRTLSRTVRVEVLQIVSSPGTTLTEGQPLDLTCAAGGPLPPDLRVRWVAPKEARWPAAPPAASPRPPPARLHLPAVGGAEGGAWRCELWRGQALLTSAVVELRVETSKVSVWLLVTLCAAAAILLLLVILIVIVQRRRQRRTRRHKRLCHCKNPKPKGFHRS